MGRVSFRLLASLIAVAGVSALVIAVSSEVAAQEPPQVRTDDATLATVVEFLDEQRIRLGVPGMAVAIVVGAESVHGAQANSDASQRRAAISVRYVGDDARWDPRSGTDPIVTQEMVSIKPGDPPMDDTWFPEVWRA